MALDDEALAGLRHVPVAISVIELPECRYVFVNDAYRRQQGRDPVGALLHEAYAGVDPAIVARIADELGRAVAGDGHRTISGLPVRFPDGTHRWYDISMCPWRREDGVARVVCTTIDVSAVHEVRAAAERSAARMAILLEAQDIWDAPLDEVYSRTASRLSQWLGDACVVFVIEGDRLVLRGAADRDAGRHRDLLATVPGDLPLSVDAPAGRVARTGEPFVVPVLEPDAFTRAVGPDHLRAYVARHPIRSILAVPIRLDGETVGVLSLSRYTPGNPYTANDRSLAEDLGARIGAALGRRRGEEALVLSERRHRAFIDATTQLTWGSDHAGNVFPSPSWEAFTGQSAEDWRTTRGVTMIHPDDLPQVHAVWQEAWRQRTPGRNVCRIRRADGRYAAVEVRFAPVLSLEGELREWVATGTDVTATARQELKRRVMAAAAHAFASPADEAQVQADLCALLHPAHAGLAAVIVAEDGALRVAESSGGARADRRVGLDDGLLGSTLDESVPVLLPDGASAYPELVALLPEVGAASGVMIVPLRSLGEVFGLLVLARSGPHAEPFCVEDRDLFGDVAQRAALAVQAIRRVGALELARAEAVDANRRKDDFLAMLGHELRNPLAPMLTTLRLMEREAPTTLARHRGVLLRQTQHLARLVDDLLDVARLLKGGIPVELAPAPLGAIVEEAAERAAPLLTERGHLLHLDVPPDATVHGDAHRLTQVFGNLLVNAAKFTPPGGRIRVAAEADGDGYVVRVSDTGRGVAPDQLARIFEPFVQGPQGIDRAEGGLGLGLSVVRSIVELHGGRVSAHSAGPGAGTTVEVRLRRAGAADAPSAEPAAARARGVRRVLVVDDNHDAADALAEILRSLGHRVTVAHDGESALGLVDGADVDVAVLDLGLPGIDGFELARRLRSTRPEIRRIVALSGYGQASDRQRATQAGFDDLLVKPADLDQMERLLAADEPG